MWHYYGSEINGDSDTLYCYTDAASLYLGINVDMAVTSYLRIFKNNSQIDGGYFSGYQWEVEVPTSDLNGTSVQYTFYLGST